MTTSPSGEYADLDLSVGDRLRRARERRTGLDQTEFAAHINVSRGTVSNYERDKLPGGPRQRLVLNAWAAATGVTREWLESGIEARPTPPDRGGLPIAEGAALDELAKKMRARSRNAAPRHTREYMDVA